MSCYICAELLSLKSALTFYSPIWWGTTKHQLFSHHDSNTLLFKIVNIAILALVSFRIFKLPLCIGLVLYQNLNHLFYHRKAVGHIMAIISVVDMFLSVKRCWWSDPNRNMFIMTLQTFLCSFFFIVFNCIYISPMDLIVLVIPNL